MGSHLQKRWRPWQTRCLPLANCHTDDQWATTYLRGRGGRVRRAASSASDVTMLISDKQNPIVGCLARLACDVSRWSLPEILYGSFYFDSDVFWGLDPDASANQRSHLKWFVKFSFRDGSSPAVTQYCIDYWSANENLLKCRISCQRRCRNGRVIGNFFLRDKIFADLAWNALYAERSEMSSDHGFKLC